MDYLNKIVFFSIISGLILTLSIFIKHKINKELNTNIYYLKFFSAVSLSLIILLNIYEITTKTNILNIQQEITTGQPEF